MKKESENQLYGPANNCMSAITFSGACWDKNPF